MRMFLIHGGLWDGWWLYQRADGRYRLMRDLAPKEVEGLGALHLEDVTPPTALRRVKEEQRRSCALAARPAKSRRTSLTLIEGGE